MAEMSVGGQDVDVGRVGHLRAGLVEPAEALKARQTVDEGRSTCASARGRVHSHAPRPSLPAPQCTSLETRLMCQALRRDSILNESTRTMSYKRNPCCK